MAQFSVREIAVGSFGMGMIGLAIAIPGYLRDWNEYRICSSIAGFESCAHRAYSFESPQPPGLKPVMRYFGEPLTKSLGIGLAVLAFPIAAYAAREMAEIKEFDETIESVIRRAAIQFEAQQRSIDNKVGADGYEAMKSYEMADIIDRFRETFRLDVTVDEIEAQLLADQQKLQQTQNYKALEFDVNKDLVNDTLKQDVPGRQWSEAAQNLYAWLMSKEDLPEVINSDWLGKQSFDGRKLTKDKWVPLAEELIAESLAEWVDERKSFRLN